MNRTWPGTSTNPTSAPDGSVVNAKPEVDRQPARLLLGEAVGVGAGEREHQRRLAVVDVARGGDGSHRLSRRAGEVERRPARRARVVGGVDGAEVAHDGVVLDPGDHAVLAEPGQRGLRRLPTSTATPTDGIVEPGQRPAAGDGLGVDDLAPSAARDATAVGPGAQLVDRRRRHAPQRNRRPRRRRDTRARRTASRRASPCRRAPRVRAGGAATRPTRSARPTITPACGPPSSLSPEKVTSAAPASMRLADAGLVVQPRGRRAAATVWSRRARPDPASTITGGPSVGQRRRSAVDSVNPTIR